MIFISTIFTTVKHKVDNDYYLESESVTQEDIAKVDAEIIQELKELYFDED